jgi:hypothetical protein
VIPGKFAQPGGNPQEPTALVSAEAAIPCFVLRDVTFVDANPARDALRITGNRFRQTKNSSALLMRLFGLGQGFLRALPDALQTDPECFGNERGTLFAEDTISHYFNLSVVSMGINPYP